VKNESEDKVMEGETRLGTGRLNYFSRKRIVRTAYAILPNTVRNALIANHNKTVYTHKNELFWTNLVFKLFTKTMRVKLFNSDSMSSRLNIIISYLPDLLNKKKRRL
jgi:hypothetical protein